MKYGIFSDVHGNLEAFAAVLEALEREDVGEYVFAGDIVGYGADPKACVGLLRGLRENKSCLCVAGNHDYGVAGESMLDNFNLHARIAAEWTRDQLDQEDLDLLRSLDLVERRDRFSVVHATLTAPEAWGYILDIDDAYENFQLLKRQVCFIGHSHKPVVFVADEMVDCHRAERTVLKEDSLYFVNIGSVGQPRDGDPRAAYCVFDDNLGVIDLKRVSYNIKKAQAKIISAGLPRLLAERLAQGL